MANEPLLVNVSDSRTRFVMPFRYQLCPGSATSGCRYEPVDTWSSDTHRDRRAYLNIDTASILFERTKWFQLTEQTPKSLDVLPPSGRPMVVTMAAPFLVLFECEARDNSRRNPLQIGFLVRDASFHGGSGLDGDLTGVHMEDLLWFNEVYRFVTCPYDPQADERRRIKEPGGCTGDKAPLFTDAWSQCLRHPLIVDGRAMSLDADMIGSGNDAAKWYASRVAAPLSVKRSTTPRPPDRGWSVYPDERAYVWTRVSVNAVGGLPTRSGARDPSQPETSGYWAKLLNVDKFTRDSNDAIENVTQFESDWARRRTYRRWSEQGTYYGFSEHSGAMMVTNPARVVPWASKNFDEVYFDQVLLLLYLRVAAFRFSERLAEIASAPGDPDASKCQALRQQFVRFTTLYRYPLVSYQQQGIEMYSIAREIMDINGFVRELDSQMGTLDTFLAGKGQQRLGMVATGFTLAALLGLAIQLAEVFIDWRIALNDWKFAGRLGFFLTVIMLTGVAGYWWGDRLLPKKRADKQ